MIAYSVTSLIEDAISAISLGSTYSLYALGIALVFGVMGMINFAHGDLITIGVYTVIIGAGIALAPLVALSVIVVVAVALLTERLAFRPVRNSDTSTLLVTSFAVSFFLQALMTLVFGSRVRSRSVGESLLGNFDVGGVTITYMQITTIVLAFALAILLTLFLTKTVIGLQMRAAAEDFHMARLLGVRADSVIAAAFALSGVLAAAGAFLLAVQTASVTPTTGVTPVLIAFIATVIGGVGSLKGAAYGGMLMGIATVSFQILLPLELRPYRDALVFMVVLAVLVLRPGGLVNAGSRARSV